MDETQKVFRELCAAAMAYCVNAGVISSVASRWPDDVQENWLEKLTTVTNELVRETVEAQDFAEAYDDR